MESRAKSVGSVADKDEEMEDGEFRRGDGETPVGTVLFNQGTFEIPVENEESGSLRHLHGEGNSAPKENVHVTNAERVPQGAIHAPDKRTASLDLNKSCDNFSIGSRYEVGYDTRQKSRKRPRTMRSPCHDSNDNVGPDYSPHPLLDKIFSVSGNLSRDSPLHSQTYGTQQDPHPNIDTCDAPTTANAQTSATAGGIANAEPGEHNFTGDQEGRQRNNTDFVEMEKKRYN
ncbi:hypothetical protein Hanom_Chr06g00503241 [Helianthus anomalus]